MASTALVQLTSQDAVKSLRRICALEKRAAHAYCVVNFPQFYPQRQVGAAARVLAAREEREATARRVAAAVVTEVLRPELDASLAYRKAVSALPVR